MSVFFIRWWFCTVWFVQHETIFKKGWTCYNYYFLLVWLFILWFWALGSFYCLLAVPPPSVFVVRRFDRGVDRRMDLHFDFGSSRHFGSKVLPVAAVWRRWRRGQRRRRAFAARTHWRTATAISVARCRFDHHFGLNNDFVRTRPRRRFLRDGRQWEVRTA